ncbi:MULTISPECIES: glycine C-acetyltransferase [unclassified Hahella]|uniref:glycine C-acetyltransferase n=1 Tax=unclassified Hahella TaxID=2624107 RepID=UPI001C1F0437|nr:MULTISPECIES: glycine C-acetyltransferase [unclassified Hahella]MBU6954901.1 glycine C-acetyltransferase [Hahella sp. HN01]MDG9669683.1 glycine C-acetyltransferase [Hahella sp. CR1]
MNQTFQQQLQQTLDEIEKAGLFKKERVIDTPQAAAVKLAGEAGDKQILNLCANNYLGLADNPEVIAAAHEALDKYGFGMASVRFICGTQTLHKELEHKIAEFLGMEDSILFAACFDANGGLFEPLLSAEDAIVSDSLNHASIIDGIRLCKAKRYRFGNRDLNDLEAQLKQARADGARNILVATDGVFSMDGYIAPLKDIVAIARKYDALVMVDDCHATGVIGPQGKGSAAYNGVEVDIITGTLGKALGGAAGGFIAASRDIIELLRQRARPYLFSNSLPPPVVAGSLKALEISIAGDHLRDNLREHAAFFRNSLSEAGFKLLPGEHAIIPVMLGDAKLAQDFAKALYEQGVYVTGFFYPVVPQGQARIRTQMNAALTREQLEQAVAAFTRVGQQLGVIGG